MKEFKVLHTFYSLRIYIVPTKGWLLTTQSSMYSFSCVSVYTYVFVQYQVCRPLPLWSAHLWIVTWKPLQFPLLNSLLASDSLSVRSPSVPLLAFPLLHFPFPSSSPPEWPLPSAFSLFTKHTNGLLLPLPLLLHMHVFVCAHLSRKCFPTIGAAAVWDRRP